MSKRVIRGYWDCPYCKTKEIDGLVDRCPNCGTGKPADIKYYMKSKRDTLKDEELLNAGIGLDENDGKHKEWVCPYCGQLNNWGDQSCVSCGGLKESKEKDYGETIKEPEQPVSVRSQQNPGRARSILIGLALLLVVCLFPLTKKLTVTGYHWQTTVTVEDYQVVEEDDWSLPDGAELIDSRKEIHHYNRVVDHYETVAVQRSREVYDGSYESCSYEDNGNGTFSEVCTSVPEYRTEYYTDYVNEPVYRDDPIYQTKYYYKIMKWIVVDTYTEVGEDKNPQYSDDYTLSGQMRDDNKEIRYFITLDNGETREVSESLFAQIEKGDTKKIKRNLLGMTYSESEFSH